MDLASALRLGRQPRLALVGAGGKTTAMFRLARELLARRGENPPSVLVSATTHLASEQIALADFHDVLNDPLDLAKFEQRVPTGVVLLTGPVGEDGRTSGMSAAILERLRSLADRLGLPLLIEADGSRRRPLKAPDVHEPALPGWVDSVVVVAGLSALGQPLSEKWVHRPERFASLSGLGMGERITPAALSRVLCHPQGGLKDIPAPSRRVALLNQADIPERQAQAAALAQSIQPYYSAVLVAALGAPGIAPEVYTVHERVAGIILAAGESRRLGRPKQLLEWRGRALVWHVVQTALKAGLSQVILVTGAHADQVQSAVQDLPLQVVYNPDWQSGQSSSLVAGLRAADPESGAAVFLLTDQPQIPTRLVLSLVEQHSTSLAPLVVPLVDGQRGNPVLFDRVTFPDLLALQGDTGGRAIFSRYPVAWLPWHDPGLLLDVDTPEDYQRLLAAEGEGQ